MPIPDYQSLMLPVLQHAATGLVRVPTVANRIADQLGLSADEREELLPSGRQRILHNRIHWAKFYMSKAGLIDSPSRGVFSATDAGRALLRENPSAIDVELLKRDPKFRDFIDRSASKGADGLPAESVNSPSNVTPEEQIEIAADTIHSALKAELLQRIARQSPRFLEELIVDLLVAMGYGGSHERAAQNLGRSGDGGVDGVIDEDRLGLDRVYVQAKLYQQQSVGRPDVQGFVGSLVGLGANKGVFVTTATFSSPAVEYVRHIPQRVVLIDGDRLGDLLIEHDIGVRVSRTISVKRIDDDFFGDD